METAVEKRPLNCTRYIDECSATFNATTERGLIRLAPGQRRV